MAANVGTYSNVSISVSDGKLNATLPVFAITVAPASSKSVTLNWTAPSTNTDGTALSDLAGYTGVLRNGVARVLRVDQVVRCSSEFRRDRRARRWYLVLLDQVDECLRCRERLLGRSRGRTLRLVAHITSDSALIYLQKRDRSPPLSLSPRRFAATLRVRCGEVSRLAPRWISQQKTLANLWPNSSLTKGGASKVKDSGPPLASAGGGFFSGHGWMYRIAASRRRRVVSAPQYRQSLVNWGRNAAA